jgi:hydroxymethylbilane synthase
VSSNLKTGAQPIRVLTRKSALALRQSELAVDYLKERMPEASFEIIPMSTTGDERLQWSLETEGGKGLFTSALEEALREGMGDLAVHSAKDLPTELGEGLVIAGYLPRARANDVLVVHESVEQPRSIATGSPRRRAQLKLHYPDVEWMEIRGNVETRLRKISEGYADATVLALAGLERLQITDWPGLRFEILPLEVSIPAAGQGAIALQSRVAEASNYSVYLCEETAKAVTAEKAFLASQGGGCHTAVAAHFVDGRLFTFA